jgi:hypothetical protein
VCTAGKRQAAAGERATSKTSHLDGYDAEASLILRRCQHANGTCQLRQVRERYGVQGVEGVAEPGSVFLMWCIFVALFLISNGVAFYTIGVQIGEGLARSSFMCVRVFVSAGNHITL